MWNIFGHRGRLGEMKYQHYLTANGFSKFSLHLKILFFAYLKHSSFLPSADDKPTSNDQAHATPLAVHVSSFCVYYDLSRIDLSDLILIM
jgi:hypothetical protein